MAEFIELLRRLRIWAGSPSYRTLARRVGPLLRPAQSVSQSTIGDVFQSRRRRLDAELVVGIVRALGLDEPAVDRWRGACVRVHAEAKTGGPVGVVRQLPADLATFTGREGHLEEILDVARAKNGEDSASVAITAVEGMGGVGKTQLAVHAAHLLVRSGRFADVQLYVDLRGFDADRAPADPSAVLDSMLRALGVAGPRIPAALEERAAMFRDQLSGRDALLILDNAADERQVRDLIPGGTGCLVLITSRRSLSGLDSAVPLRLDVFSTDEGVQLFARIVGPERVAADPACVEAIVAACGRLPLAVSLAAALLRSRPAWSLAHLATRLQTGGLNAVSAGGRGVRPVFELSYQALPDELRRLFRLLSVHPGADFAVPAVVALAGVSTTEAEAGLERLLDEHLLEQKAEDRYAFHDMLRVFAGECLYRDEPSVESDAALDRILTWYLQTSDAASRVTAFNARYHALAQPAPPGPLCLAFDSAEAAQRWWDAEFLNLLAIQATAIDHGRDRVAGGLPHTLSKEFNQRGLWEDWISASRLGLEAARRENDLELQGFLLNDLGSAYARRAQFDAAKGSFATAVDVFHVLGDAASEALVRVNFGGLCMLTGELTTAGEMLRQALDLSISIGDKHGQAAALDHLGGLDLRNGAVEAALAHRSAARVLQAELGNRFWEAVLTLNIGESLLRLGRLDEAIAELRASIRANRELDHRIAEGYGWEYLGEALEQQHDCDGAVEAFQRALALLASIDPSAVSRVSTHLDRVADK